MKGTTAWCAALLASLCLMPAHAVDRLVDGFPELPKDARAVAERSVACSHLSGESNGDGGARDKEVAAQFRKQGCARVAQDLETVRAKYRKHPGWLAVLREADAPQER